MKIELMRERLTEAIALATEEKIIQQFHATILDISRSEVLTLEEIQDLIRDAEADARIDEPTDELLEAMIGRTKMALEAMQQLKAKRSVKDGKVVGM